MSGQLRRINSGSAGIVDAARCPACGHPARIHNVVGCVSGPCECVVTRAELMPDAPRLEVPDGVESTPAVKAAAPTDASAAAPVAPVRPLPAWDPGVHTPGAGWARAKAVLGDMVPDLTEADERAVDDIIAAGKAAARKRPRLQTRPAAPTAQGYAAVVGERDAVEEVTAGTGATGPAVTTPEARTPVASGGFVRWEPVPSTVQATPEPFDFEPLLARALYVSARWYCPKCHQWPLNPGACPVCRKPLQAVYHVTIPREHP